MKDLNKENQTATLKGLSESELAILNLAHQMAYHGCTPFNSEFEGKRQHTDITVSTQIVVGLFKELREMLLT